MRLPIAAALLLASWVAVAGRPIIDADDKGNTSEKYRAAAREQGFPVLLKLARPVYPQQLADRREAGCVVVGFTIRKDGKLDDFKVLDSKPAGKFDQPALLALLGWQFEPQAVPREGIQPFVFKMEATTASKVLDDAPDCPVPDVNLLALKAQKGKPKVVSRVAPSFPQDQARLQDRGCVLVSFDLKPDGRPQALQVIASKPAGAFDKAVLGALEQWRFAPKQSVGHVTALYGFSFVGDEVKDLPRCSVPTPLVVPPKTEKAS